MQIDNLVANIALLVIVLSAVYVACLMWPESIVFKDGLIIRRRAFKKESLRIADLQTIMFHYHAVIGFTCVWEFVDKSGRTISVGREARIDRRLVKRLAQQVPGFSESRFDELFAAGDVEDSLEVWRADATGVGHHHHDVGDASITQLNKKESASI